MTLTQGALLAVSVVVFVYGGRTGRRSEAEVAQARVIIRATAQGPVVLALGLADRQVVDASKPDPHQAVVIELPGDPLPRCSNQAFSGRSGGTP